MRAPAKICGLAFVFAISNGCEEDFPAVVGDPRIRPASAVESRDLGFNEAFDAELGKVGQISVDDFARRYSPPQYIERLSWDPTTAKFWDRVMADPKSADPTEAKLPPPRTEKDMIAYARAATRKASPYDFRLQDSELEKFRRNGFVVSERMGSHSFTDLYYRIYVHDLPVFVTADSVLHAWHRQYDRLLEDLETAEIAPALDYMLGAMSGALAKAKDEYGRPLQKSAEDVDFFLCVARRLLNPKAQAASIFEQGQRVDAALAACVKEASFQFELFGQRRDIDFSQFKPRGRYDQTDLTKQYFRAVMWLGRIDFRLAGTDNPAQEQRELAAAIVLDDLLHRSGQIESWRSLDGLLTRFVGNSDCLNFTQLDALLQTVGTGEAKSLTTAKLRQLHEGLSTERIETQQMRGDLYCSDPNSLKKAVLPLNFAFLGQRFILDSWALTKVVYDDVFWNGEKVKRRMPSCLDASFAVFGNDAVTPELCQRLGTPTGKRFRDGLPYQHNLSAVRTVIDGLPDSAWNSSIYTQWLACLRELSKPTTSTEYPEAVQTEAWAQRTTETQLASWTEMRHDTVLYAKPSYTSGVTCYYPAAFVEPVPHFWRRLDEMVRNTLTCIEGASLPSSGKDANRMRNGRESHVRSLKKFAEATTTLRAIAEKELAQAELTAEETKFLQEIVVPNNMCGAPPIGGWYPQLFSRRGTRPGQDDAQKWTAIVTDVHTDPPAPEIGDSGGVLHEGIGNVDLLIVAIDNGADRVVYLGPVFSHYEFDAPADTRLTNGEWQTRLRTGQAPDRGSAAAQYLSPGMNPDMAKYGLEKE